MQFFAENWVYFLISFLVAAVLLAINFGMFVNSGFRAVRNFELDGLSPGWAMARHFLFGVLFFLTGIATLIAVVMRVTL